MIFDIDLILDCGCCPKGKKEKISEIFVLQKYLTSIIKEFVWEEFDDGVEMSKRPPTFELITEMFLNVHKRFSSLARP